jgi:hypothetical protein
MAPQFSVKKLKYLMGGRLEEELVSKKGNN